MESLGGEALVVPTDVADAEAVEGAAERIESELGPIVVWVNNAMTTVFAPFGEVTPEEFRRVTEVTYLGQVYGTQAALRRMAPRDRGTIVLVGSALAYRGIPLQSAYCGSKHAIKGFFESVRPELLHDGSNVHLTMVQLPGLNTPQFRQSRSKMGYEAQPVAPIYQPELAARAIVWASRQKRREVCVGTSTVMTILGNKLAPRLAEGYLARTGYDGQQKALMRRRPARGRPCSGRPGGRSTRSRRRTPGGGSATAATRYAVDYPENRCRPSAPRPDSAPP